MTDSIFWIIVLIAMLVIELGTASLTTIWFCGGAIPALIIAVVGGPLWLQCAVFGAVSAALLLLTRPLAMKYLNSKAVKTNADSLVGKQAVVTEEINNLRSTGTVQVSGQEWTARLTEEYQKHFAGKTGRESITKGSVVVVRRIEGVKLMVEPAVEAAPVSENTKED